MGAIIGVGVVCFILGILVGNNSNVTIGFGNQSITTIDGVSVDKQTDKKDYVERKN